MFKKLCLFLLCYLPILTFSQQPFECDGNMFFSRIDNGTKIYRFDDDFNFTLFLETGLALNAMSFNPYDSLLYAIDQNNYSVIQIDQVGNLINLGQPLGITGNEYYAGAFDKEGLFILSGFSGANVNRIDVNQTPPLLLSALPKIYSDPSLSNIPAIGDIAYDPITGIGYGFDNAIFKLVSFDAETGIHTPIGATNTDIPVTGALTFNGDGNLYGMVYTEVYRIDITTGIFSYAAPAPFNEGGIDACSCPFYVDVLKSIEAGPYCEGDSISVELVFLNNFFTPFEDVVFHDFLGMMDIIELPNLPFYGDIVTNLNENILRIENITLPVGKTSFSFKMVLNTDIENLWSINNQAQLIISHPSPFRLDTILSDDPNTVIFNDATEFFIYPYPEIPTTFDWPFELCPGDQFDANLDLIGSIRWDFLNGETLVGNNISISEIDSTYAGNFEVFYTDSIGCKDTASFPLTIFPAPSIQFPDGFHCLDSLLVLQPGNFQNYLWSDGSQSSELEVEEYGDYWVEVMDFNGCVESDSIQVESDCPSTLYIPNAFSPNFDGINDVFYVYGKEVTYFHLKIYNRWGALVFESFDLLEGWDGRFKDRLMNPAIFTVVVEAGFLNGESVVQGSDLVLVR